MKSADSFYNALESEDSSAYASDFLLQPHPIQVLSILRFIGCDSKTSLIQKLSFAMTPFDPNKDDLATKIESVITECIKMKK